MSARDRRLAAQAEPMKELEKLLRENSYRHQLHTVFGDFVEMAALSLSNSADRAQYDAREKRYLDIVGRYNAEEVARFPQMFGCLVMAFEAEMGDHLGRLFMALELGNHWKGQFFTPYALGLLMAQVQFGAAAELVRTRGFVTVCDPCCGAGCLLIAAAQALREQGLNYEEVMHAQATDVDPTAAHMAYVQLSLLHVPAVVVVGDSLRMETREVWRTPAHVVGLWDWRLAKREDAPVAVDAAAAATRYVGQEIQPVPSVEITEASAAALAKRAHKTMQLDLFGGAA